MLSNKRILFIAPLFHGYEELIACKLEQKGAQIVFFAEREYGFEFKFINNLINQYLPKMQERHYNRILRRVENEQFDYLFVVRGFMINERFVEEIRRANPGIKTIMYQWDSNRTNPFEQVISSFDKVFSFDYKDCEDFPTIKYLPLFYTDDVVAGENEQIKYDFFFMGTYIPERYKALLRFKEYIDGSKWRMKSYIYIVASSLKKERLRGKRLDMTIVSTRHMSRQEYLTILRQSRVIVDVSNSNQTGMAMRIIEALAAGKKILTSNQNITKEPFYNEKNISVFDVEKPSFTYSFVECENVTQNQMLSMDKWLNVIFSSVK